MSENIICKDKAVYFTYSITADADGNVVEQSKLPVGYVHGGKSELIDKLEASLEGLKEGDSIDVPLTEHESMWAYDSSLTFTDDIGNVPEQFHHIGAKVEMVNDSGETKIFLVTEIEAGRLTVDGNHPLAGKPITFHVLVKTVRDASTEEIKNGHPEDNSPESVLH